MRDERPQAVKAAELSKKGFLTTQEIHDWVQPYSIVLDEKAQKAKLLLSPEAKFLLDGRVTKKGRKAGRWFVGSQGRTRRENWRVRPDRIFDPVYLQGLYRRMCRFRAERLAPAYEVAAHACKLAMPEGGTIYHSPRPGTNGDGSDIYYQTVTVPKPDDSLGLSFGSTHVKPKETNALKRLAEVKEIWAIEESYKKHAHLGEALEHAYRREMRHDGKTGFVQNLFLDAIVRHLPPPPYNYGHYWAPRLAQIRVLDTIYYFSCDQSNSPHTRGWRDLFVQVDGEKDDRFFQLDFQRPEGR
jgi:hypothetical protein